MAASSSRDGATASNTPVPSVADVMTRLDEFRRRRGYLMAHQGVMAAALPNLQDAYGVIYKALTLDQNHLEPLEKEFVWLALLVTVGEHIGTHHIELFYRHGGTQRQAEAAFRLVAWAAGTNAFEFLDAHWQGHFDTVDAHRAYRGGVSALIAGFEGVTAPMAHLALLTCHTARRVPWGIAAELEACYAGGLPEVKMAEAISLPMWPCGVNSFLDASAAWLALIREGRVQPSPPFRAWADTLGQDGLALSPGTGSKG